MRHSAQDRHAAREGARVEARDGKPARPSRTAQVPYWLTLCGIALGLLWIRGGERDVRGGTLVIAGVLLAAAVARLGLPDRRAGMLSSRRRILDVAAFAILGIGLLVAGLVFPTRT